MRNDNFSAFPSIHGRILFYLADSCEGQVRKVKTLILRLYRKSHTIILSYIAVRGKTGKYLSCLKFLVYGRCIVHEVSDPTSAQAAHFSTPRPVPSASLCSCPAQAKSTVNPILLRSEVTISAAWLAFQKHRALTTSAIWSWPSPGFYVITIFSFSALPAFFPLLTTPCHHREFWCSSVISARRTLHPLCTLSHPPT